MSTMVSEDAIRVIAPLKWVDGFEAEYFNQMKGKRASRNAKVTLDQPYCVGQVVVPRGTSICIFPLGSSAVRATMTVGDIVINILSRGRVQVRNLGGLRYTPGRDRIGASVRLFGTRL